MYLSGITAMASIDPWKLWQGKIRPAFPQRIALGIRERGRGGKGEEVEKSRQVDGLRLAKKGVKQSLEPYTSSNTF